jgi:hypothetical protein
MRNGKGNGGRKEKKRGKRERRGKELMGTE